MKITSVVNQLSQFLDYDKCILCQSPGENIGTLFRKPEKPAVELASKIK